MVKYLSLILVVICASGLLQGAVGRVVRRSYDQGFSADQPVPSSNYGGSAQPASIAQDLTIIKDAPVSNYGSGEKSFKSSHVETRVQDQPTLSGYAKRDAYGFEQPAPVARVLPIIKAAPVSNYGSGEKSFKSFHVETRVRDQPALSGYAKSDSYGFEQPAPVARVLPIMKAAPVSNYGSGEKSFHLETRVRDQPALSGYAKSDS